MRRAGAVPAGSGHRAGSIRRRPTPPHAVPLTPRRQTVYEVELSAAPSPAWRAAFLRPPAPLTTAQYTPDLGRLGLDGARVIFRTPQRQLHAWLRRIDRWVAYANLLEASICHPGG